ncbi:MAG TPA: hypothetical protein VFQ58_01650, partial [Flavisolibacter sp.]|nr:hypothetical protein [Flavisolibacter sp.]
MRTTVPGVRTLVLICIITISSFSQTYAQSISTGNGKIEVGLGLGPMFFLGDLGGHYGVGTRFLKDLNIPLTQFSKGLYLNLYPAEFIGFRVAFNQGKLTGDDAIIHGRGGDEEFRLQRNLEFQTNIWEAYGAIEFYPTVFMEQYDGLKGKLRPYGILGFGVYHFNPKARYFDPSGKSTWVDLQPLRLEGQGMSEYPTRPQYSLTQYNVPMGAGFKYYIKDNFYVGFEILYRKTFTDYIDNVSKDYIDANLFDKYLTPQQSVMAHQLYYRENLVKPGSRPPNP